ncbi:MAG: hypothetical protein P8Y72_01565 [Anaerolineales bacterium]|jgi:hypothetical protein
MAAKRKTADFYKQNPESYRKKLAYDKKRNARPEKKKYRAELARERRARGIMGKGGKDVSHQEGGGFKLENPSKNRARNGHGKNAKLAPGKGSRKSKR